jgi:hypothetical protein
MIFSCTVSRPNVFRPNVVWPKGTAPFWGGICSVSNWNVFRQLFCCFVAFCKLNLLSCLDIVDSFFPISFYFLQIFCSKYSFVVAVATMNTNNQRLWQRVISSIGFSSTDILSTDISSANRTECNRHLCRKTAVFSYHRCIKTLVLKQ